MKRCSQCWTEKPASAFIGARGKPVNWCMECRARRDAGGYVRAPARKGLRKDGELRVTFSLRSGNRKTGPIPVSISSSETCPPSCSFFGAGCYAEFHYTRLFWSKVPERGLTWAAFLAKLRSLENGTLWRHNEAGDLPGIGEKIDVPKLLELVLSNVGLRGFTFTHKRPRSKRELDAFHTARALGFVINLSTDSLDQADMLAALDIAPVSTVVPSTMADRGGYTPAGRKIVVCPAETSGLTCEDCQLCAQPDRRAIVAFRAHGQMKAHVNELVQLRRSA